MTVQLASDGTTLLIKRSDRLLHRNHVRQAFNTGKGHQRLCRFRAFVGQIVRFIRMSLEKAITRPNHAHNLVAVHQAHVGHRALGHYNDHG